MSGRASGTSYRNQTSIAVEGAGELKTRGITNQLI